MRAVTSIFCGIFLFLFFSASAENVRHGVVRRASAEKVKKYFSDSDFNYGQDYQPSDGIGDLLLYWFLKIFVEPVLEYTNSTFWTVVLYVFFVVVLVLIVRYIIKGDRAGLLYSTYSAQKIKLTTDEEDMGTMNFDQMIEKAVQEGRYRIAVRYLYLKSLHELSVRNMIVWKADKTNYDYIRELRSSSVGIVFRDITKLFDYAWYGDAAINEQAYTQIRISFDTFNKQVETTFEKS